MQIRAASDKDIPAIVSLLKLSLGESSSKKTVDYWKWKHLKNPFGPSPVLLAELDGNLVGVRAMMQWQWNFGQYFYKALRAVDTATHPAFQGRGIFKKLTSAFKKEAAQQQFDFIFNTPNHQSLPGYLKMGWKKLGYATIAIKPVFSFFKKNRSLWGILQQHLEELDFSTMPDMVSPTGGLYTPKSWTYLKWRYQDCPIKDYGLIMGGVEQKKFWIFIKLKKRQGLLELRICDYVMESEIDFDEILSETMTRAKELGTHFLSFVEYSEIHPKCPRKDDLLVFRKKGPIVTIFDLLQQKHLNFYSELSMWNFQIGDLELF